MLNRGRKHLGSVRVQYLAQCELICPVPAEFLSTAKVDSAVVRLRPRQLSRVPRPHRFETLVKLGFAAKRKMLRNNLKGIVDRSPHPIAGTIRGKSCPLLEDPKRSSMGISSE